ncbi:LysR family transcriptional regulator [Ruegeria marisrubri]|uniref:LysR family transcriptional regulator n=1 Tax=Ruegeria marisrubri TaxID=1685379 RepID=UPI001CD81462|nr:LysR family transcriptional regulator [Ruegeria marisrubri]MCA0907384.1 LysR family transcriptional regulator [Ruegeria marisrubri]
MPFRYTLRQLEYFVAVGKAGSISAASEVLNVSSPSISAAINQLEAEFGLNLFVREHARGLSLTKAGHKFLERTEFVLREVELLSTLAGDITGKVQGILSVGCLVTFAQIVLPGLRRGFEELYPDVRIEQRELNQADIFSQLRRAELDIALTYDLDIPADLKFLPLLDLPPYVVLYEGHPFAQRETLSISDLKDSPMVLLDLPYSSDYFLSFFRQADIKPNVAERTGDMSVMRSLVANGYGFSIANVRPLNNLSPDGKKLIFVPLSGDLRPMKFGVLKARIENETNTMAAFIDHCKTTVETGNLPFLQTTSAS